MRIAYLAKELPYGATEAFILPEIAAHEGAGWEVWLVPLARGRMVHGAHLLPRTIDAPLLSPAILGGAAAALVRHPARVLGLAVRMLRAPTPRLALRNLAVLPKGLWLGRQLRRRGIEHVHIHWAAAPATMGVVAATIAGLPCSITAHRYDIAQNNLLTWKSARARFVRAIDQPGAAEIQARIGSGGATPIVLHMGVAVPEAAVVGRGGVLRPLRIATAARLVEKKGHHFLMEAIARAGQQGVAVEWHIFGDGPLRPELERQASALGLEGAIRWHGVTPHDTLLARLRAGEVDVAALPSITARDGDKEGIPVFLIEAMAAGLPALTTANGGIEELAGGGAALLVPERDGAALADALVRLARNEALRRDLAAAGRARVLADFEIGACMLRLRDLIAAK